MILNMMLLLRDRAGDLWVGVFVGWCLGQESHRGRADRLALSVATGLEGVDVGSAERPDQLSSLLVEHRVQPAQATAG
jgi:hypothetical protein